MPIKMNQVSDDMQEIIVDNYVSQGKMYWHLLQVELSSVNEIITWATHVIANTKTTNNGLIELAACQCQDTNQVLAVLFQFTSLTNDDTWWKMTKQRVAEALINERLQAEKVVSYFHGLALVGEIPAYDREALFQFELEYACINEGFATQHEVDNHVKRFFK